jgi:two-component system, cell cycle response regulator DivK
MTEIKVLLVEDNEANRELATALLEAVGQIVLHAGTGEEAIRVATSETPAIVLMDISLPGMDGLTATKILKQNPKTEHIPVVALTAHAMKGDEAKALEAGCAGYITKPIDTRSFSKSVANFIQDNATV